MTATTHITADFTHKETQLAQVQMFLDAVSRVVAEEKGSAVLLPGDFNAQVRVCSGPWVEQPFSNDIALSHPARGCVSRTRWRAETASLCQ